MFQSTSKPNSSSNTPKNHAQCVHCPQTRYTTFYEVFILWGHYCLCTHWHHFGKKRVLNEYCNFDCPGPNHELKCGGNLATSVYCEQADHKCVQSNDEKPKEGLVEQFPAPAPGQPIGPSGPELTHSYIGCVACDYSLNPGLCQKGSGNRNFEAPCISGFYLPSV